MITKAGLNEFQGADFIGCDLSKLIDLRDVSVDRRQSVDKRIECFVQKINNPYLFRVNEVAVKVEFNGTKSLAQILPKCFAIGE